MENLEYRIGGLDSQYPTSDCSIFIVHRENENTLGIYELAKFIGTRPRNIGHKSVVWAFNLSEENVLGGGMYSIFRQELTLNDYSADFGSIPNEAAQKVGETLADYFRQNGVVIEKISLSMTNFFKKDSREIWKSLGYNVPE